MIPKLMLPEDCALLGPGPESGLKMIFGDELLAGHIGLALSWVHEHFNELAFAAEHVLCEFSKYAKITSPKKYRSRPFDIERASLKVTRILPKNWKPVRAACMGKDRKYTNPEANEYGEYVPSAIIGEAKIDRALHYRARWEGWGPNADTWEPTAEIKKQVPDVVETYSKKLSLIEELLENYRADES
ncbi:unnamed protein product [Peniophora sp. CBMAI 1063]|nr:unnamed protein product [Peniophora sp. CBMAI 1063]